MKSRRENGHSRYLTLPIYCGMVVVFAIGLIVVYVVARVTSLMYPTQQHRAATQGLIHRGARLFYWIVSVIGLVRLRVSAEARSSLRQHPGIIVANHPSMLDALAMLALSPRCVCVLKPALQRVPFLGGLASMAGYVSGANPEEFLRDSASRIAEGTHVVIFPEGTRSPSPGLNPFKRGAAWVASHTGCPIFLFVIRMNPIFLGKNGSLFSNPRFPVDYLLDFVEMLPGRAVAADEQREAVVDLTGRLEERVTISLCSG